MKSILRAVTILAVGAILAPELVHAAEPERVVVRNRKYTTDGKFEASANVGLTLVDYLTNHTNLSGGLAFNISEQFAIEVGGGYAMSSTTKVAKAVADSRAQQGATSSTTASSTLNDDFSDLWRMTWSATAVVRWAPIYGKMNVAAELPVHFKAYLLGGGGYGGFVRDSIVYCAGKPTNVGNATCEPNNNDPNNLTPLHETGNKPVGVLGAGLRFFTNEWSAVQVELRDVFFKDDYRVNLQMAQVHGDTGIKTGQAPKYNSKASNPGLTHLPFVQLGMTFSF